MDARGVLIEPRRDHVLGFFHRDAVDVVDLFAGLVVAEAMRAAGEHGVVIGVVEIGQAAPSCAELDAFGRSGTISSGAGAFLVALAHHDPAHIVEHRAPFWSKPRERT